MDLLERIKKLNGLIETEDDAMEFIERLTKCDNCKKTFWDKLCPNCVEAFRFDDKF